MKLIIDVTVSPKLIAKPIFFSTKILKSSCDFVLTKSSVVGMDLISALMRQNSIQFWMRQRNSDCSQRNKF